ncbi:MAG: hypothetical protein SNJ74_11265 [Fimbriimonadaceae bacterium]
MKDPITTKKEVVPMGDGRKLYRYTFELADSDTTSGERTDRLEPTRSDRAGGTPTGNLDDKAGSNE